MLIVIRQKKSRKMNRKFSKDVIWGLQCNEKWEQIWKRMYNWGIVLTWNEESSMRFILMKMIQLDGRLMSQKRQRLSSGTAWAYKWITYRVQRGYPQAHGELIQGSEGITVWPTYRYKERVYINSLLIAPIILSDKRNFS